MDCNNCDNVVRYYDVWIERITPEMVKQFVNSKSCLPGPDGKPLVPPLILFIQIELCDLSLSQWLSKNSGSTEDIWDIFTQIVEGLSYIHGNGFIHRDIKPSNIFLKWRDDGRVGAKLGDLGLAKFNQNMRGYSSKDVRNDCEGDMTQQCGTMLYMAPEQHETTSYTNKVDMYALGILLFEMFTDFKDSLQKREMIGHLHRTHRCPLKASIHDMAPNAAKLVEVLIQKDPGKRFSANQVMRCDYLPVSRPANLTQSAEVYIQKEVERRMKDSSWTSRTSERAVSHKQSTGASIKKLPSSTREPFLSNRSATSGSYPSPSDSKPSHQSCPGQPNKSKPTDNGPASAVVRAKRSKSYAAEMNYRKAKKLFDMCKKKKPALAG